MKRYKLYQGKMREDENGPYVKNEDVTGLFPANVANAPLDDVLAEFMKEADDFIESHNEENIKMIFIKVLGKYFS